MGEDVTPRRITARIGVNDDIPVPTLWHNHGLKGGN